MSDQCNLKPHRTKSVCLQGEPCVNFIRSFSSCGGKRSTKEISQILEYSGQGSFLATLFNNECKITY